MQRGVEITSHVETGVVDLPMNRPRLLNGHAVRVPLLNASITDAVFEMQRPVTEEEVNGNIAQGRMPRGCG